MQLFNFGLQHKYMQERGENQAFYFGMQNYILSLKEGKKEGRREEKAVNAPDFGQNILVIFR